MPRCWDLEEGSQTSTDCCHQGLSGCVEQTFDSDLTSILPPPHTQTRIMNHEYRDVQFLSCIAHGSLEGGAMPR
eukprot:m.453605 g.453605  ORF g.453605 m.453605 type:complete len:74 (-) comp20525_c0_seq1:1796-2017(-)